MIELAAVNFFGNSCKQIKQKSMSSSDGGDFFAFLVRLAAGLAGGVACFFFALVGVSFVGVAFASFCAFFSFKAQCFRREKSAQRSASTSGRDSMVFLV